MDNLQILIQAILSLKDTTASKNQIAKELPKLESQLQSDKNTRVNIVAGLNINKSKNLIQSQLNTLVGKTNSPTIKVGLDLGNINATKNIVSGLKDIQTQAKQASENINKAVNSLTNLSSKYTNPITPIDVGGIIDAEKTIEKVQRRFQELGEVSIKGVYSDNNAVDSLDKMIVSIKNGQNEARTLTFELDKMGRAFYLTGGTSDNSGIQKQVQNINKAFTDYTQKLAQFKSTNHEILSGLVQPLSDFETKLNGLKTGTSSIDEVATAFKSLQTSASNITQNFSRQLSPIDSAIRNIAKGEETIAGLQAEFRGLANSPKEINTELTECVSLLNNVKKIESEQGRTDNWSKAYREWIDVVDQLQAKLKALRKEQNNSAPSYNTEIGRQITSLTNLSNNATFRNNSANTDVQVQREKIQALITEYQNLRTQLQGNISPEGLKQISTTLTTLESQFDVVQNECNELKTSLNNAKALNKFGQDVELLRNRIISLREANSKSVKQFGQDYEKLLADADGLQLTFTNGKTDFDGLNNANRQLRILEGNIKNANKTGHTLFQTIGEQAKKFASWMSLTTIIAGAARSIRNMIREVVELDSAMTSLKKVTDETDATYSKFLDNASKRAKELGTTITDLVESTSEFAKLGYSIDDAAVLGEVASVYSNVGELDIADATASLVSSMAAFGIEAQNAMEIVDRFNAVGNQFSISSAGIGDALQRSASSLKAAGNSIDESIAMITAANVVVQDPDIIGTSLKTLSLRLTSTSAELEALGEDTEYACETLSDYRNLVMGLTNNKVDIIGDDGQYKNTYNILKDISKVWHEMDSMSQSSLMKSLFGVRQANVGVSLIEQFSTAERVLEASLNSSGSAMEEHSRWLESANAKAQQFKASFESLSQTVFDSDFLKSAIDAGTSLLNVFEKIVDTIGTLPLLLGAISGGFATKNIGLFQIVDDKASESGQKIMTALKARQLAQKEATEQLEKDIQCLTKYENICKKGNVTAADFTNTMQDASLSAQDYAENIKNGTGSAEMYASSQKKIQAATKSTTIATKALSVAVNALAVILITQAIGKLVEQIDKWIITTEEAKENTEDLISAYQSALETANSNAKSAQNLEKRYKELSKGVSNLGENISLTTEEYDEYNSLVNQIADMFPTLVQGYTDEGNAILTLKGNVEQLRDTYKEAQQAAQNLLIANGEDSDGNDIIKNWGKLHDTGFWSWLTDFGAVDVGKSISHTDAIKQLEAIQSMSAEHFRKMLQDGIGRTEIEKDIIYDSYIPNALGINAQVSDEDFAQAKKQAKALVQTYNAEIKSALESVETLANAYLLTNEDYNKLSEQSKNAASILVNNLNSNIASSFNDKSDVGSYVDKIIQAIISDENAENALQQLFTVNTDDMSISEIKQFVDNHIAVISDALGENADELKIRLGFEDVETLETRYNSIMSQFAKKEQDKLSQFFNDSSINSTEELDYWQTVTKGATTASEAIEKYRTSLEKIPESIDSFKDKFSGVFEDSLEPALSEVDKIKSAMQTLASGELLEWGDVSELMFDIDTERILGDFEEIDGKYRLINNDITSLIKLKDSKILKQKEVVQGLKDEQQETLRALKASLELEKSKLSRSNSKSDAEYYKKQIQDIQTEINKVNSNIRDCDTTLKHLNSQLGNTVDLTSALEERMKKAQEHADKYADAMLNQVSDIIDKHESEKDILEKEKESLEEQLSVLEEQKDELEEIIDNYKTVADVVESVTEKEIDLLKEQQETQEEVIQAKIDALKEAREQQEEENDLIEKELTLQQKLRDLEKAKQTKVRTYSESRGWHHGTDKEAVANAQTAVNEAQADYDKAIDEKLFNDQIEALEKEKELITESFEEQIKAYEDYYEQWKEILDEQTNAENEQLAQQILGVEWREKIKKKDTEILNKFSSNLKNYNNQLSRLVSNEIDNLNKSIKAKENEIKAKDEQIQSWKDYQTQVEKTINSVKNKYDEYIGYLGDVAVSENSSYKERESALKNFKDSYSNFIDEIQWLQQEISDKSATLSLDADTYWARQDLADFFTDYKNGLVKISELMRLDPALRQSGLELYARLQTGGDIDEEIDKLRYGSYSTGGTADYTGLAMLHGTKSAAETIFNAQQSKQLYDMVRTGNFSQLVAQKAVDGLKTALKPNQISNSTNDSRVINIQNMTIKSDNPTQFHDQFMKEIGQYWRVELAESRVK